MKASGYVKHKAEDLIEASDSIGASECRFIEAESSIAVFRMDEPAALSLHDTSQPYQTQPIAHLGFTQKSTPLTQK